MHEQQTQLPTLKYKSFLANVLFDLKNYATYCGTSGCIPLTWLPIQILGKFIAWFGCLLWLGKIRHDGAEWFKSPGRKVYIFSHSAIWDGLIMYLLIPGFDNHILFAAEFMSGLGGWLQIFTGAMGAVPVDRGHGHVVIEPCAQKLAMGMNIGLCPEGRINADNVIGLLKPGFAEIARGADVLMPVKLPICILSSYIHYNARDFRTATGPIRLTLKWRRGAVVVTHPPTYVMDVRQFSVDELVESARNQWIADQIKLQGYVTSAQSLPTEMTAAEPACTMTSPEK